MKLTLKNKHSLSRPNRIIEKGLLILNQAKSE